MFLTTCQSLLCLVIDSCYVDEDGDEDEDEDEGHLLENQILTSLVLQQLALLGAGELSWRYLFELVQRCPRLTSIKWDVQRRNVQSLISSRD